MCEGNVFFKTQRGSLYRESVLFIGTQFSNLYTAVDTPVKPESAWGHCCPPDHISCITININERL
jgi:hypothetical protein